MNWHTVYYTLVGGFFTEKKKIYAITKMLQKDTVLLSTFKYSATTTTDICIFSLLIFCLFVLLLWEGMHNRNTSGEFYNGCSPLGVHKSFILDLC